MGVNFFTLLDKSYKKTTKYFQSILKTDSKLSNVIKLRDDKPSGYYCLDGIFI